MAQRRSPTVSAAPLLSTLQRAGSNAWCSNSVLAPRTTKADRTADLVNEHEQPTVQLIWDGLPSHRSRRTNEWVASRWRSSRRTTTGYAPDVNPIEQVCGRFISQELANLCSDAVERSPTSQEKASSVSAATLHSALVFSVFPTCDYDRIGPAILQSTVCRALSPSPRVGVNKAWANHVGRVALVERAAAMTSSHTAGIPCS